MTQLSVITPAHNEEQFIERCLESVRVAAEYAAVSCEHIVVLNRCTDRTEALATSFGCRIVNEDARNLSRIRNAGIREAQSEIIVTIDADSWMSPTMLSEVIRMLETGRYIGGGVSMYPERMSPGIFCSLLLVAPFILYHRVSAGLFWFRKEDFDAVGGFDESLACVEDIDFAKRLKAKGRETNRRYGTIWKAHITTSCRKFDQFGDWCFVKNPRMAIDLFRRKQAAADKFYYDVRSDDEDQMSLS